MTRDKLLKRFSEFVPSKRFGNRLTVRDKSYLDFSCWDIFNLRENGRFLDKVCKAIRIHGLTGGSSRYLSGTAESHSKCESRFARFFGTERALLFPTRNQLVLTLVTTLCDGGAILFCDERSESPIVDSGNASGNLVCLFQQNDVTSLEGELERFHLNGKNVVFVEGIQGFNGEVLDYQKVESLRRKFLLQLCIDESLSLGVIGIRGAGSGDGMDPLSHHVCRYATFDRHLALPGAVLCGSNMLIEAVLERSKNYRVEMSSSPFLVASAIYALDYIELATESRVTITTLSQRLYTGMVKAGYFCNSLPGGAFVCMPFSSQRAAHDMVDGLRAQGIFVDEHSAFIAGREIFSLRFIVTSGHSKNDIDFCIDALIELRRRIIEW